MRTYILILLSSITAMVGAQVPATDWLRTAGGFDQFTPYLSALDPTGALYTCGYGEAVRNYGSGITVADTGFTIARYDTSGTILWARPLTTSHGLEVYVHNIAATSTGELWMTGYFYQDTLTIDGFELVNVAGSSSMFLARFDGTGAAQYAAAWGGVGSLTRAQDVFTDALDRVYVTGRTTEDTLDFDGISVINSAGGYAMFVLALDASGVPQWASMSEGTAGITEGLCVAADGTGNVFATVRFDQSITIGTETLSTGIDGHIALIRFTSAGAVEWMHAVAKCDPLDLAVDAVGNSYVCGDFQFDADFDGTLLVPSVLDGFVSAYDNTGAFRWVTAVQGAIDNELCWSVQLDHAGTGLVVCGTFVIEAAFGGLVVQTGISPTDGFIMHMDTDGGVNWVKDMTGDGPTLFAQACLDEHDRLYTSGVTQSGMSYLGEPVLNGNGNNAFLARFEDIATSVVIPLTPQGLLIHPNPNDGVFQVELPVGTRAVLVEDALGRILQRWETPFTDQALFRIGSPGIYQLILFTDTGRKVGRVVVE